MLRINNFVVKPLKGSGSDNRNIRGYELFPQTYPNVCILGPKKSGKTVLVYRILEQVAYKTNVIIFSSTAHQDDTYKKIVELCKKKKCNVIVYDHFIDKETGVNRLEELRKIQMQSIEAKDNPEPEKEIVKVINFGDPERKANKEVKEKKDKLITPEYIIIYDDLSSDMRNDAVYKMLIKNRHFKTMNIICIHNLNDLIPGSWQNLDFIIAFPNINKDKILELSDKIGMYFKDDSKRNNVLYNAYEYATKEPFNFLYINRKDNELRKNFNIELLK